MSKNKVKLSGLIKRFVAGTLILTFLLTNQTPSYAAASAPPPSVFDLKNFPEVQSVHLPKEMGRVEEVYQGSRSKTVIIIQDAHAIADAQKNIQRIISYFQKQYGVQTVALEGASSRLDPQIFESFPDKKNLRQVFSEYLNQGELTAGTAAALFSSGNKDHTVYQGVEDWELYEEGLGLYLASMKNEEKLLGKILNLKNDLKKRKENLYPKDLLEIDQKLAAFGRNELDFPAVLKALAAIRKPESGTELGSLLQELEGDKKDPALLEIEVKKISVQVENFLNSKSASKSQKSLQSFHGKLQDFQTSRISAQEFALFLKELIARDHLAIKVSQELSGGMENRRRMRDIEGTRFFRDFEIYGQSVKESLMSREEQRKLDEEDHALNLLEKLVKLELSREEWGEYQKRNSENPAGLNENFVVQENFYRNAEARDGAFLKNMELLSARSRYPIQSALLVAGGFHAQGLTRRLKDQDISYLLVMPAIGNIPKETPYENQMMGNVSWKNYFKVENGKINFYQAFVRATRDRLLALQTAEGGRSGVLKNWRDQIIRDLASKNEIEKAGQYTRFIDESLDGGEVSAASALEKAFAKIDRFVAGLRGLEEKNQLTEATIIGLVNPSAAIPEVTANQLDPLALGTPVEVLLARSETRDPEQLLFQVSREFRPEMIRQIPEFLRTSDPDLFRSFREVLDATPNISFEQVAASPAFERLGSFSSAAPSLDMLDAKTLKQVQIAIAEDPEIREIREDLLKDASKMEYKHVGRRGRTNAAEPGEKPRRGAAIEHLDDDVFWLAVDSIPEVRKMIGEKTLARFRAILKSAQLQEDLSGKAKYSKGLKQAGMLLALKLARSAGQSFDAESLALQVHQRLETLYQDEVRDAPLFFTAGPEVEINEKNAGKDFSQKAAHVLFFNVFGGALGLDALIEYALEPADSPAVVTESLQLMKDLGFIPNNLHHSMHVSLILPQAMQKLKITEHLMGRISFASAVAFVSPRRIIAFLIHGLGNVLWGKYGVESTSTSGQPRAKQGGIHFSESELTARNRLDEIRREYRLADSANLEQVNFLYYLHGPMYHTVQVAAKLAQGIDITQFEYEAAEIFNEFNSVLNEIEKMSEAAGGALSKSVDWSKWHSKELGENLIKVKSDQNIGTKLKAAMDTALTKSRDLAARAASEEGARQLNRRITELQRDAIRTKNQTVKDIFDEIGGDRAAQAAVTGESIDFSSQASRQRYSADYGYGTSAGRYRPYNWERSIPERFMPEILKFKDNYEIFLKKIVFRSSWSLFLQRFLTRILNFLGLGILVEPIAAGLQAVDHIIGRALSPILKLFKNQKPKLPETPVSFSTAPLIQLQNGEAIDTNRKLVNALAEAGLLTEAQIETDYDAERIKIPRRVFNAPIQMTLPGEEKVSETTVAEASNKINLWRETQARSEARKEPKISQLKDNQLSLRKIFLITALAGVAFAGGHYFIESMRPAPPTEAQKIGWDWQDGNVLSSDQRHTLENYFQKESGEYWQKDLKDYFSNLAFPKKIDNERGFIYLKSDTDHQQKLGEEIRSGKLTPAQVEQAWEQWWHSAERMGALREELGAAASAAQMEKFKTHHLAEFLQKYPSIVISLDERDLSRLFSIYFNEIVSALENTEKKRGLAVDRAQAAGFFKGLLEEMSGGKDYSRGQLEQKWNDLLDQQLQGDETSAVRSEKRDASAVSDKAGKTKNFLTGLAAFLSLTAGSAQNASAQLFVKTTYRVNDPTSSELLVYSIGYGVLYFAIGVVLWKLMAFGFYRTGLDKVFPRLASKQEGQKGWKQYFRISLSGLLIVTAIVAFSIRFGTEHGRAVGTDRYRADSFMEYGESLADEQFAEAKQAAVAFGEANPNRILNGLTRNTISSDRIKGSLVFLKETLTLEDLDQSLAIFDASAAEVKKTANTETFEGIQEAVRAAFARSPRGSKAEAKNRIRNALVQVFTKYEKDSLAPSAMKSEIVKTLGAVYERADDKSLTDIFDRIIAGKSQEAYGLSSGLLENPAAYDNSGVSKYLRELSGMLRPGVTASYTEEKRGNMISRIYLPMDTIGFFSRSARERMSDKLLDIGKNGRSEDVRNTAVPPPTLPNAPSFKFAPGRSETRGMDYKLESDINWQGNKERILALANLSTFFMFKFETKFKEGGALLSSEILGQMKNLERIMSQMAEIPGLSANGPYFGSWNDWDARIAAMSYFVTGEVLDEKAFYARLDENRLEDHYALEQSSSVFQSLAELGATKGTFKFKEYLQFYQKHLQDMKDEFSRLRVFTPDEEDPESVDRSEVIRIIPDVDIELLKRGLHLAFDQVPVRSEVRETPRPSRPMSFYQGDRIPLAIGGAFMHEGVKTRKIETLTVKLSELDVFAFSDLAFKIKKGSELGIREPWGLQIWLDNQWQTIPNLKFRKGMPLIFKRGGKTEGGIDLEGKIGIPMDAPFPDATQKDREIRISIFGPTADSKGQNLYLPRSAFSASISRGQERLATADRPGYDVNTGTLLPLYTQPGHVEIQIMGDHITFSDLGSTVGTEIKMLEGSERNIVSGSLKEAQDQGLFESVASMTDFVASMEQEEIYELLPNKVVSFNYEEPFSVSALIHNEETAYSDFAVVNHVLHVRNSPGGSLTPVLGNMYFASSEIPVAGQSQGIFGSRVAKGYRVTYDRLTKKITVSNYTASLLKVASLKAESESNSPKELLPVPLDIPLTSDGLTDLEKILVPKKVPQGSELVDEIEKYIREKLHGQEKVYALENLNRSDLMPYVNAARKRNVLLVFTRNLDFLRTDKLYMPKLAKAIMTIPLPLAWQLQNPLFFAVTQTGGAYGFQRLNDSQGIGAIGMTQMAGREEEIINTMVHELLGHQMPLNGKRIVYDVRDGRLVKLEAAWKPLIPRSGWVEIALRNRLKRLIPLTDELRLGILLGHTIMPKAIEIQNLPRSDQELRDLMRKLFNSPLNYYNDILEIVAFAVMDDDLRRDRRNLDFDYRGTRDILMATNNRVDIPVDFKNQVYVSYVYNSNLKKFEEHYLQKQLSGQNILWQEVTRSGAGVWMPKGLPIKLEADIRSETRTEVIPEAERLELGEDFWEDLRERNKGVAQRTPTGWFAEGDRKAFKFLGRKIYEQNPELAEFSTIDLASGGNQGPSLGLLDAGAATAMMISKALTSKTIELGDGKSIQTSPGDTTHLDLVKNDSIGTAVINGGLFFIKMGVTEELGQTIGEEAVKRTFEEAHRILAPEGALIIVTKGDRNDFKTITDQLEAAGFSDITSGYEMPGLVDSQTQLAVIVARKPVRSETRKDLLNPVIFQALESSPSIQSKETLLTLRPYSSTAIDHVFLTAELGKNGEHILIDSYSEIQADLGAKLRLLETEGAISNLKAVEPEEKNEKISIFEFDYKNQKGVQTRQKVLLFNELIPRTDSAPAELTAWQKYLVPLKGKADLFVGHDWHPARVAEAYALMKENLHEGSFVSAPFELFKNETPLASLENNIDVKAGIFKNPAGRSETREDLTKPGIVRAQVSEKMPAYELLQGLGFLDIDHSASKVIPAPKDSGLTIYRKQIPAREDLKRAPYSGFEMLTTELARSMEGVLAITEFDFIYNEEGQLIAIYPAPVKANFDLIPQTTRGALTYFNFSEYYFEVPQFGADDAEKNTEQLWQTHTRQVETNQALLTLYSEENNFVVKGSGFTQNKVIPYMAQSSYLYAEVDEKGKVLKAESFAPHNYSAEKFGVRKPGVHQLIFPLFPSVYSPAEKLHKMADNEYYDKVSDTAVEIKSGDDVLVSFAGSGFDTWLAYLSIPESERNNVHFHVTDINPAAVANVRAFARMAGFKVNALRSDNLRDETGGLVFKSKRFKYFFGNMAFYQGREGEDNAYRTLARYWDGVPSGHIERFTAALEEVLEGKAILWNGKSIQGILEKSGKLSALFTEVGGTDAVTGTKPSYGYFVVTPRSENRQLAEARRILPEAAVAIVSDGSLNNTQARAVKTVYVELGSDALTELLRAGAETYYSEKIAKAEAAFNIAQKFELEAMRDAEFEQIAAMKAIQANGAQKVTVALTGQIEGHFEKIFLSTLDAAGDVRTVVTAGVKIPTSLVNAIRERGINLQPVGSLSSEVQADGQVSVPLYLAGKVSAQAVNPLFQQVTVKFSEGSKNASDPLAQDYAQRLGIMALILSARLLGDSSVKTKADLLKKLNEVQAFQNIFSLENDTLVVNGDSAWDVILDKARAAQAAAQAA